MPSERIIGDGMETLLYVIVAGDAFLLRMIWWRPIPSAIYSQTKELLDTVWAEPR